MIWLVLLVLAAALHWPVWLLAVFAFCAGASAGSWSESRGA